MKKQLLIIGIIVLLITVGLSGCEQKENKSDGREWHELFSGWLTGGNLYNGTMFFANDFTPINLEKQERFFFLTMHLLIDDYCDNLTLITNRTMLAIEHPEKYGEQNGSYRIEVYIPVKGNISDYPYDEYQGNISFITTDNDIGIINLDNITSDIVLSRWRLNVSGESNHLFFTFRRNEERRTFEILEWFGGITLFINSLSFALSIIFYYIIYTFPNLLSGNALNLLVLVVLSIILGAFAFAFREGKTQKLK